MTTTDTTPKRQYHIGNPTGYRLLFGKTARSKGQAIAVAAGVFVFLVLSVIRGFDRPTLITGAVIAPIEALLLVTWRGEDVTGLLSRKMRSRHQKRTGTDHYTPEPWEAGHLADPSTGELTPVSVAPPECVGEIRVYETEPDAGGNRSVVVHSPRDRRISTVIKITGPGGAMLDDADRDSNADLRNLLFFLIHRLTRFDRIQIVSRTIPNDLEAHRAFVASQQPPDAHPLIVENYENVINETTTVGEEQGYWLVCSTHLTADTVRTILEGRKPGDTLEDCYARHIAENVRELTHLLPRTRYNLEATLDATAYAALVRALNDPSYHPDDHSDANPQTMWSEWTNRKNDLLISGPYEDWLTRAYWISHYPVAGVSGDHFRNLFLLSAADEPTVRTVSIVMDLIPQSQARATALSDATADAGAVMGEESKGKLGIDATRMTASTARLNDLANGMPTVGVRLATYIALTTPPTELPKTERAFLRECENAGVVPRPMTNRHDIGLRNVLPLGMGLSRANRK